MSRTIIIVAGCLGGSARSIRCRGPALARRPHRAVVDASGDAGRAITAREEEEEAAAEGPTGLLQGFADPVSRRGASFLLSAGCCLSSSQRCDDSTGEMSETPVLYRVFASGTTIRGEMSKREREREARQREKRASHSGFSGIAALSVSLSNERLYQCNFGEPEFRCCARAIAEERV